MALDVAILGENGESESAVPIRVDEHARLLGAVEASTSPLLSRLRDYYEDAEYELQELDDLVAELGSLRAHIEGDAALAELISSLRDLVLSARRLRRGIVAIAD